MIKNHVTTLETSKHLKELGVKQESEFAWFKLYGKDKYELDYVKSTIEPYENKELHPDDFISAFLSSELGEMLPRLICDKDQPLSKTKGKCYPLIIEGLSDDYSDQTIINGWSIKYGDTEVKVENEIKMNSAGIYYVGNEAEARAKMLIYLLENNLIELE